MTALSALWLPILVAAAGVWLVSSIIHMAPLWHRSDYPKLAKEAELMDAVRPLAIPPGDYMVPRPSSMKDMRSPEFLEKRMRGPIMLFTIFPGGPPTMAPQLILWFLYCVVVGFATACVAALTQAPGADDHAVFHVVALVSFLAYTAALWQMSIWYRRAWSTTIKATLDGLIYAGVTAIVFTWLWPR